MDPSGRLNVGGDGWLNDPGDRHQAFFFWTGWNASAGAPTFKTWRAAEPQPEWQDSQEYQAARKAAGLN
jgi:hypothetical protein